MLDEPTGRLQLLDERRDRRGLEAGPVDLELAAVSVSIRIREPGRAAAAAAGASTTSSPRLTQFRRKMRAKLGPTIACTPHAFIASERMRHRKAPPGA